MLMGPTNSLEWTVKTVLLQLYHMINANYDQFMELFRGISTNLSSIAEIKLQQSRFDCFFRRFCPPFA